MAASDGGIFSFGDAPFLGSLGGQGVNDVIGIVGTAPTIDLGSADLSVQSERAASFYGTTLPPASGTAAITSGLSDRRAASPSRATG